MPAGDLPSRVQILQCSLNHDQNAPEGNPARLLRSCYLHERIGRRLRSDLRPHRSHGSICLTLSLQRVYTSGRHNERFLSFHCSTVTFINIDGTVICRTSAEKTYLSRTNDISVIGTVRKRGFEAPFLLNRDFRSKQTGIRARRGREFVESHTSVSYSFTLNIVSHSSGLNITFTASYIVHLRQYAFKISEDKRLLTSHDQSSAQSVPVVMWK